MVNAFWLDRDLDTAATWLVDRHVTSSVFECSMALTTAVQLDGYADGSEGDDLYFTHADHPLVRWAGDAHANWEYLHEYVEAAHEGWRYRWDHGPEERHACWTTVESLGLEAVRSIDWPTDAASDPPQVTGDWVAEDYVDAYRYYYANEKRNLFEWSKDRSAPPWLDAYTVEIGATELPEGLVAGPERTGGSG